MQHCGAQSPPSTGMSRMCRIAWKMSPSSCAFPSGSPGKAWLRMCRPPLCLHSSQTRYNNNKIKIKKRFPAHDELGTCRTSLSRLLWKDKSYACTEARQGVLPAHHFHTCDLRPSCASVSIGSFILVVGMIGTSVGAILGSHTVFKVSVANVGSHRDLDNSVASLCYAPSCCAPLCY